jgi:tRNA-splicing ligase RtcB
MSLAHWFVSGPLPADVERSLSRLAGAPGVVRLAVMPDVHLAEAVCIGVVLATDALLYPAAVGGDIGCGMLAEQLDVPAERLADARVAARVLAALGEHLPRDRHRRDELPPWPPGLDCGDGALGDPRLISLARRDGRAQLGTLGSGNHFIELQQDEEGSLWLMLHSGSRGLGPAIRAHREHAGREVASGLRALEADSEAGQQYLRDAAWARRYAAENRAAMRAQVEAILHETLGAHPVSGSLVSCDHNHVQREEHEGRPLWVHRKGAISARAGEMGIIPGSMGSPSYHVEGRGHADALQSASHGAGRVMSRSEARRRITPRELRRQLEGLWYDHRMQAALLEEAPGAYKDIGKVMRAQRELVRIVRTLTPVLCFKGG